MMNCRLSTLQLVFSEEEIQKDLAWNLIMQGVEARVAHRGAPTADIELVMPIGRLTFSTLYAEVKQRSKPISTKMLNTNLSQLEAYLDRSEHIYGALVIVNRSKTTFLAEPRWFRQRLAIVAINIEDTPSRRERTYKIDEVGGSMQMFSLDSDIS